MRVELLQGTIVRVELREGKGLVGVVELRDRVAVPDDGAAPFLKDMAITSPGKPRVRLRPEDGDEYLRALEFNFRGVWMDPTSPIDWWRAPPDGQSVGRID